ncbi:MAG: T9SS type A sorting domain-containing protein [Bacteroidetes bacterium]|nr:T9SS type A sorting domain-containing protein [Bacteroidota bacterium]
MKKNLRIMLFVANLFISFYIVAGIPPGYYNSAAGLAGTQLKTALHNIIKNHTVYPYSSLENYYPKTDKKANGKVWDMYSDIPGGTAPYEFNFTNACGSYNSEDDCWNKEHSFPQSWFNSLSPMKSDLFHVYPTDGWVNNKRGNLPYGDVGTADWTSQNGSKVGSCSNSGYSGDVFEPIDSFKGDFARTYFYMAVRYFTESSGWSGSDMVNGAEPKPWALAVLEAWNILDPVSTKERNRNDSVYSLQHNRNPFIDNPQWVDYIWGDSTSSISEEDVWFDKPNIYPNPANKKISVDYYSNRNENIEISLFTIAGKEITNKIYNKENNNFSTSIELTNISKGVYFVRFLTKSNCFISKLVVE